MTHELGEAVTPDGSVFEFRTESRRADAAEAEPGPTWRLYVERDTAAPPTRLSFTAADGAHSAVAFDAGHHSFLGTHRAADGSLTQVRGTLERRRSLPALPLSVKGRDVLTFTTHEEDGRDEWRRSGRLRLLLQDGRGVAPRDLEWQDEDGTEVALSFSPDHSGFLGHIRHRSGAPIGYRGFAIPAREMPTSEDLMKELEEFGRQAVGIAEDLVGRIAGWLGGGNGRSGPTRPA